MQLLKARGPMHYQDLADAITSARGLAGPTAQAGSRPPGDARRTSRRAAEHGGLDRAGPVDRRTPKGQDRELTEAIWAGSGKIVNSRYTYGHWLVVQKYETSKGRSRVSKRSPP